MTLPTLKEQRAADIARFYDEDLPNVESATTAAVSGAFLVRMEYPDADQEGAVLQRDVAICKVLITSWPAPAYRDAVVVAGDTWKVANVRYGDAFQWKLKLEKDVHIGMGR